MKTNNKKTLRELMDLELERLNVPDKFRKLECFINHDQSAAEFIRFLLNDDDFRVPDENSDLYEIAQSRARHSAVNYLLGLVFRRFGGIFQDIHYTIDRSEHNVETEKLSKALWLITALYHDKAYSSEYLKKADLDYRKSFKRYLLKDCYNLQELKCLDDFSIQHPQSLAYSYRMIEAYDQYAVDYHSGQFAEDEKERKRHEECVEKRDHGILGGVLVFNDLTNKAIKQNAEPIEFLKIKACCLAIAQHNIYKSQKAESDKNYDGYKVDGETVDLSMLHHDSSFRIQKDTPLLLFLSLVDTFECVKKFSKKENDSSFIQTCTVLSSILVSVSEDRIEVDFSKLKKAADQKYLSNVYAGYIAHSLEALRDWTAFRLDRIEEKEHVYELRLERASNTSESLEEAG